MRHTKCFGFKSVETYTPETTQASCGALIVSAWGPYMADEELVGITGL